MFHVVWICFDTALVQNATCPIVHLTLQLMGSLCYASCLWVPSFITGGHPVDWRLNNAVLVSFGWRLDSQGKTAVAVSPQSCHVGTKRERERHCMIAWVGTSQKMVVLSHGVSIPIPHMKWVSSKWGLVLGQRKPHSI